MVFKARGSSGVCRRASHAGSWYTNNSSELSSQIAGWLSDAAKSCKPLEGTPRGLIGPHAGYSYSGPTAAFAYNYMIPDTISNVFVLGPSHAWYLPSCALPEADVYETPIGTLQVNTEIVKELRDTKMFSKFELKRDEKEHSLEMHMPFIAHAMRGKSFKIVPILVGAIDTQGEKTFGDLLAPYVADPTNFFVVSSDFCHWGSRFEFQPHTSGMAVHESISQMDHEGMRAIEALDTDTFAAYLARTHNTICGRHPIAVYMHALKGANRNWKVKFVHYAQSSQAKSMHDSSVSYASGVVTQI